MSGLYRYAFNDFMRNLFEQFCLYCKNVNNNVTVTIVLGFYVNIIATRWWEQFMLLPWPDRLALYLNAHLSGDDKEAILYRRAIMRYCNASYCIALRAVSSRARLRFPTDDSVVKAGLLTQREMDRLQGIKCDISRGQHFVPINWAHDLVMQAREKELIRCDVGCNAVIECINDFRGKVGDILLYDWVNPPLVYTQMVTIAVTFHFVMCIFSWQFTSSDIDYYVPVIGILNFIFLNGWMKVAECMINPFGNDDDDFEIEYIIERNLNMSYRIVDHAVRECPIKKDTLFSGDFVSLKDMHASMLMVNEGSTLFRGSLADIPQPKVPYQKPSLLSRLANLRRRKRYKDSESSDVSSTRGV